MALTDELTQTYEQFNLDVFRMRLEQHMTRDMLHFSNIDVATRLDHIANTMVIELEARIAGMKHDPMLIQVPDGWVQAFRDRFQPQWTRARFPIRYVRVQYNPMTLFPDIAIKPGEHVVKYVSMKMDKVADRTSRLTIPGASVASPDKALPEL